MARTSSVAACSDLAAKGFQWNPYAKSAQLYVVGFNCQDESDPFYDIRRPLRLCAMPSTPKLSMLLATMALHR